MKKDLSLNNIVLELQNDINSVEVQKFINKYTPFIVSTASNKVNRYIKAENDEAFNIALLAFYEAIQKYNPEKGGFINFARMIIEHRLSSYLKKERKHTHENIDDLQIIDKSPSVDEEVALRVEIQEFEKELMLFNIDFDDLVDDGPIHIDTKQRAKEIGIKTSKENDLVRHLYKTGRLPVTEMSKRFSVSRKIIYTSKNYIISVIVVMTKKFDLIKEWIIK